VNGVDAIAMAGRVIAGIEKLGRDYLKEKPHPLLGHSSLHCSLVGGGTELSTYPDQCRIELEVRVVPGNSPARIRKDFGSLLNHLKETDKNFSAKLDLFFSRDPFLISKSHPFVQTLAKAYRKTLKKNPVYGSVNGWLEASLFDKAGIPCTVFGPSGAGAHSAAEYVEADSVAVTARVLKEFILDFCRAD
jgi:acetylornithine deacetylase